MTPELNAIVQAAEQRPDAANLSALADAIIEAAPADRVALLRCWLGAAVARKLAEADRQRMREAWRGEMGLHLERRAQRWQAEQTLYASGNIDEEAYARRHLKAIAMRILEGTQDGHWYAVRITTERLAGHQGSFLTGGDRLVTRLHVVPLDGGAPLPEAAP